MIRRSTWIFLGIFAVLVAAAFIWQRYAKKEPTEATPTTGQDILLNLESPITSLRIEGVETQIVELVRDEQDQLKLSIPEGEETDTEAVDSAIGQLSTLSVLSSFEQAPDLGAIGLVVPLYRISIKLENGQQIVLNVGKLTPTGSGYYVQKDDGEGVYVVSKYSLDSLLDLAKNPPVKPTPTPSLETQPPPAESLVPSTLIGTPASTPSNEAETPVSTSTP